MMSDRYPHVVLKDVCDAIDYGYTASASREAKGPKFLRITDIVPDRLDWESVPFCEIDARKLARYQLASGDIVIARTGATTGWAKFIQDPPDAVFASYLVRIRPKAGTDPRFLGHVVTSGDYKRFIQQHLSGAAQPNANAQVLTSYPFPFPPLPIQRRIAGILSAYDDLIENCERRIRVLDEMARALYREWFVHFRYPGHEKVELVDSTLGRIPKGWEVHPVSEAFEILGGGTPSRKEPAYWEDGTIQWFAPSDLTAAKTMFMDRSAECITDRGLAESSAKLFPPMSVMMTSRATIGAIAINTAPACTNQGFITCIPNKRMPLLLLFHWLRENVPLFERMASGATFKEISRGVFRTIDVLLPPQHVAHEFEKIARPIAEQMLVFQRQRDNLRQTRDLLLPRLLSGQLSVEKAA